MVNLLWKTPEEVDEGWWKVKVVAGGQVHYHRFRVKNGWPNKFEVGIPKRCLHNAFIVFYKNSRVHPFFIRSSTVFEKASLRSKFFVTILKSLFFAS